MGWSGVLAESRSQIICWILKRNSPTLLMGVYIRGISSEIVSQIVPTLSTIYHGLLLYPVILIGSDPQPYLVFYGHH